MLRRDSRGLPAFLLICSLAHLALAPVVLAPALVLAQDAPPLEAEGPPRPAASSRPSPLLPPRPSALARPPAIGPAAAKPAPGKAAPGIAAPGQNAVAKTLPGQAAKAQPGPAVARPGVRGPAVKNDNKRYLRSLDENHDGRISREEFLAGSKKRFAKVDANADGVVSPQEGRAAKARLMERKARSDARRLAQGLPVKAKAKGARPAKPYLATFDANHDSRVSRKEYLAKREKKFAEMDLNRDGVVSKDEAKAAKARLLARREERKAEARERAERRQAKAVARAASRASEGSAPDGAPVSPAPVSPLPASQ